jgi:hypothetical protein
MVEPGLLAKLIDGTWTVVRTMPLRRNPDILWDLVFESDRGTIGIKGTDHLLPNGVDVFSLRLYEHTDTKEGLWSPDSGREGLYLDRLWRGTKLEQLLHPPRSVKLFTSLFMNDVVAPPKSLLERCTAIEFFKETEAERISLVIAADQGNALCIQLATDSESRARLLEDAIEVHQPQLYSELK